MRLRDVLGIEAIGYVQMAVNSLVQAKESNEPLIDLQLVRDDVLAFKGCVDDQIESDAARNLIKCGISIERIDLYARLSYRLPLIRQEVHRLAARVNRTCAPYSQEDLKRLVKVTYAPGFAESASYDALAEVIFLANRIFSGAL